MLRQSAQLQRFQESWPALTHVPHSDHISSPATQRNFLNRWQTGLFDDIRLETETAPNGGVIVRIANSD